MSLFFLVDNFEMLNHKNISHEKRNTYKKFRTHF